MIKLNYIENEIILYEAEKTNCVETSGTWCDCRCFCEKHMLLQWKYPCD